MPDTPYHPTTATFNGINRVGAVVFVRG